MKIDTESWKWFAIDSLFDRLETGRGHDTLLEEGNECLYLGAKKSDNGIMRRCATNEAMLQDGNCIVFICNGAGSVGFANYMDKPFIATTDLVLGYANWLNANTGLFVATVLCKERFKYSFGRKWKTHLRETEIKLPVTADGAPDWQWMESYIDSLHSKPLSTKNVTGIVVCSLNTALWQWFKLGGKDGLFDIRKGRRLTAENQTEGDTPYIGAIDSNNGVSNLIGQSPIHAGNTITLSYNGSVGEAFYQPKPYWATDDVNALYLREEYGTLNPATGLFVCSVLKHDRYRYSYGRKWTLENMEATRIKLPATPDGVPDWQWMESYIESLPYGDRL